jgi:4'-phosphopantetheinyl transferase
MQALAPDAVHVWTVVPGELDDPALLDRYAALLAPDERARQARFRLAPHRRQHLVTRALVRTVLSRYASVEPGAWRFVANAHGRPEIAAPAGTGLAFNVSHTDGLVACAVARRPQVGIDVENTGRRAATVGIAERYFSHAEVAALRAVPPEHRRERFFEYWTLKEAYIKARGMGLAIPLADFSLELDADPIRIAFAPRLADTPARWWFALRRPTLRHVLALAVHRPGSGEITLDIRPTVP